MFAYHFNKYNLYDYEQECQLDPLTTSKEEKEVYLLPANCTFTKPTIKEGFTPRWNGKNWRQYADDMVIYGYTPNADGTINYYGEAHTEEELAEKYEGLSFTDVKPVSVDGIHWLSADNEDYKKAKAESEKEEKLTALDAQYESDKRTILGYYNEALFVGDETMQEDLKAEMKEIETEYIKNREAIEGVG